MPDQSGRGLTPENCATCKAVASDPRLRCEDHPFAGRTHSPGPLLIDAFCKQGGMSAGYARAGFTIIGTDKDPQPRYPFEFVQGDFRDVVPRLLAERPVAVLAGSPPCWAWTDLQKQNKRDYEDFIPEFRELCQASGLPYVIENVEGAPLLDPLILCGTMFLGLRVIRHRLFESNLPLTAPAHGRHPLVFTHDKRKRHYGQLDQDTAFVQVTGGGNCSIANARAAMGIDWMDKDGLNQAVPPAYAEHIGAQLLAHIEQQEAA